MLDLRERVEKAFRGYRESVALVRDLTSRREYAQEIILLVCARLDALSHLRESAEGDKARFVDFLARYSYLGKQVGQISVPDLYDELCRWWWTLEGFIDLPGRVHLFDPFRDQQFLEFVSQSGSPITQREVGRELAFIVKLLKSSYRVVPKQSRAKTELAWPKDLAATLKKGGTLRPPWRRTSTEALIKLVGDFTLGALLYKNYRCGAIHEYKVDFDEEQFFERKEVGWRAVFYPHDTISPRLSILFPATVLLKILETSLNSYIEEMVHKKKLPAPVFLEVCHPLNDLDLLDVDSIGPGRDARLVK